MKARYILLIVVGCLLIAFLLQGCVTSESLTKPHRNDYAIDSCDKKFIYISVKKDSIFVPGLPIRQDRKNIWDCDSNDFINLDEQFRNAYSPLP